MRFAVGDWVYVTGRDFDPPVFQPTWTIGCVCQISSVGPHPFTRGYADYTVLFSNGYESLWDENTLAPIWFDKDFMQFLDNCNLPKEIEHA